jgi:hypothetical protein
VDHASHAACLSLTGAGQRARATSDLAGPTIRELAGRGSVQDEGAAGGDGDVGAEPVISQVNLIAKPWDVGPGGYQVCNFPRQWTEWNGKFRDTVREFWRGEDANLGEFASRLTGSADLYEHTNRRAIGRGEKRQRQRRTESTSALSMFEMSRESPSRGASTAGYVGYVEASYVTADRRCDGSVSARCHWGCGTAGCNDRSSPAGPISA